MNPKTIMILGGYGNTGKAVAQLLLHETDAQIVVAGRNMVKASQLSAELNLQYPGDRVRAAQVDAADPESLNRAFRDLDMVVVASSTTRYARLLAEVALASGVDYLDVQYSTRKVAALRSMAGEIERQGRCFITDGGFHPGLPAMLVRYAALAFDHIQTARVGSVIKEDWASLAVGEEAIDELVELVNDFDMSVFKDGKWKRVGFLDVTDYVHMDFGGKFGTQTCAPMMLEEMRALPATFPTLTDSGFYVGSFNWLVDWVIMPLTILALKVSPHKAIKPMGKWMHWGLRNFTEPPYGTLLRVEATGLVAGQLETHTVTIYHPDGYMFTAIPVVACLLQYLYGSIARPGLFLQALVVEPKRFMRDIARMGIQVEISGGNDALEPQ